jgi:hypothetical protein
MKRIKPNYFTAVHNLVGGGIVGPSDGPISDLVFTEGQTPPTESAIQTELSRILAEDDAQAYARNRQAEYPDWGDQLNKIYDDGVTKWKSEMVDPIKAKYPKPS